MNLGIILPLAIYLVFIFGAALFAYVKRSKGDFLTEYYVGNRSMTGFVLAMTTASTYASASLHYFLAKPMHSPSMIYFSIVIKINISFGFPV